MKKIGVFLETPPHGGGTFQYCQTILEGLAALPREDFSVVAGYTLDVWGDYLARHYQDIETIKLPLGFWARAFSLAWLLLRLPMGSWRKFCRLFHPMAKPMLEQRCDLWIFPSQSPRSFQIPVPALVSIPDTVHRYGRRFPEAVSLWEYLNREPTYANICRWAKGVFVVSEIDRQQVVGAYDIPVEKTHILPHVPPSYMGEEGIPEGFDHRYPLPPKYLFYPAQFWEHKNHKNLLRAVAVLKPDLPDLKLVLAGSKKNATESILKLIDSLNIVADVIMLGYVADEDMPQLYRRARALVYPTYYGPCNIPPLEALSVGCPMALADVTCMPDRVGDAALVFNPDSVAEIADCIRRLWLDDRLCAELAGKGRARAAAWGQDQFNERVRQIIESVTACNRP